MSFISFSEFIAGQLDTMFIGHSLGPVNLGIYNRAYMLVYLPVYNINVSITRVLFPSFSRVQSEPVRLRNAYISLVTIVSAIVIPICGIILISAKEVIAVLLGAQFTEAVPIAQMLAIAIPIGSLHFGGPICDALARLNQKLVVQLSYLCVLLILFVMLGSYGLPGYALALLLGLSFRSIGYIYLLTTILQVDLTLYRNAYFSPLRTATIIVVTGYLADVCLQSLSLPAGYLLATKFALGTLIFLVFTFRFPNPHLRKEMMTVLTRLLSASIPETFPFKYLRPYCTFLMSTAYKEHD